jgi:predicted dehydrogenase
MNQHSTTPIRVGIIGCGSIGQAHRKAFADCPGARLTALADIHGPSLLAAAAEYPGIATFCDGLDLIRSGQVDAVSIATPHRSHPPLAIAALEQGLHVLVEKPIAVTAKAGQAMVAVAAARPHLRLAACFQMRHRPEWRAVKQFIDRGELGQLLRLNWTLTNWFRTQAYYDSAGWRASWRGEGGGLLINQCPHNLDLLQWLVGMPNRVTADVGLGRFHRIEVEDHVVALLRFPGGATGTFTASTGEAPGINRLELVGDRATLVVTAGRPIEVHRLDQPVRHYSDHASSSSQPPVCATSLIEPSGTYGAHADIARNFIDAIATGAPLTAPAAEGVRSLELGNAMLMSGLLDRPVDLPMDHEAYDRLLSDLCGGRAGPAATVAV